MVRRSRLEIYFDVLKALDKGIYKPTRLMYKANLSWSSLQDTFETLLDGGFMAVELNKKSKRYCITDKGRRALSYHVRSLDGLVKAQPIFRR
jgi:predicted transcriptional regulator